jgi:hypothetical protein
MPMFNADVQAASGFRPEPRSWRAGYERGRGGDCVRNTILLPGTLKNAIDWVSRMRPMPSSEDRVVVARVRVSRGRIRGLWQLALPRGGCAWWFIPTCSGCARVPGIRREWRAQRPKATERLRTMIRDTFVMAESWQEKRER